MCKFNSDIIADSFGDLVTALAIWLIQRFVKANRNKKFERLTIIMGNAIEHRNIGKNNTYADLIIESRKQNKSSVKQLNPPIIYLNLRVI